MSKYDYQCETCETEYELIQDMNDDKFTEHECPKCDSIQPCKRLISGGTGVIFDGMDFQSNLKNRGYKGKYTDKLRDVGTFHTRWIYRNRFG